VILARNIFGCALVVAIFVFCVFGDAGNPMWSRYDFAVRHLVICFLSVSLLNLTSGMLFRIIIEIFFGISAFKLCFNVYGLFDPNIFDTINRSYWIGGMMLGILLIFSIYKYGQLVKRKI
jgi:hypothetical protein